MSMSGASVSDDKFDSYQYQYDNRAASFTLLQPKVRIVRQAQGLSLQIRKFVRTLFLRLQNHSSCLGQSRIGLENTQKNWTLRHPTFTSMFRNTISTQVRKSHVFTIFKILLDIYNSQYCMTGLKLECTASIGPAYWHMNQESCTVTERAPDYTGWMSGAGQWQSWA